MGSNIFERLTWQFIPQLTVNNFCDRITSTQTLENIKDVDSSLNELKRISKKKSKFVNVSILWDYFRFYGPEQKLNDIYV